MWRFAFLCSAVLTLTVACGDGPGAPSVNTDELFLSHEGDPPPPPLDGGGFASFSPSDNGGSIGATESVTPEDCTPPVFDLVIEGDYFQNSTHNNARIHFTPVPGSGTGTIHETANNNIDPTDNKQDASGSIVAVATNGEKHRIHLVAYTGESLFSTDGSFGSISGTSLEAEVMACGVKTAYDGFISFSWGSD